MSAWGEPGRGYPRSRRHDHAWAHVQLVLLALVLLAVAAFGVLTILHRGLPG